MCSRYCLTASPDAVRAHFELNDFEPFPPRYNIAPGQPVAIVRQGRRGRELALVRWGLIPSWLKDPRERTMLVNARAETAADKPSFRGAMRHRRCLVPATGYYEWNGRGGGRIPHLLKPKAGGVMALAGLWEHWLGADGSEIETMAILTVPSSPAVAPIHNRMPVIVAPADFDTWLDCRSGSTEGGVLELLDSVTPEALAVAQLGAAVNDARMEGPDVWSLRAGRLL